MIKDLFCDIDGTLLFKNNVSDRDVKAIKHFVNKGGRFHLITGRTVNEIGRFMEKFKVPACYQIGNNGGSIIFENKLIMNEHIDPTLNHALYESIKKYFNKVKMFEITSGSKVFLNAVNNDGRDIYDLKKGDFAHIDAYNLELPISKFYFEADAEVVENFIQSSKNEFPNRMDYYSDITAVNVGPSHVSKGIAVQKVMRDENIKSAVIGDGGNDIPMFRVANLSFSFHHAHDHVKNEAEIIVDNVADAIEIIMNRWN